MEFLSANSPRKIAEVAAQLYRTWGCRPEKFIPQGERQQKSEQLSAALCYRI
jgi:hypothetical protein